MDRLKQRNTDPDTMEFNLESKGYECTFAPALSNKSRMICQKLDHKPIYKRYNQEISSKQASLERLKKSVAEEREEKRRVEERSLDRLLPARGLSKGKLAGRVGSSSADEKHREVGLNVNKLDTYSKNMMWHEKKNQKILELQHEKQSKALNESIEFERRSLVGSHIKPSVDLY